MSPGHCELVHVQFSASVQVFGECVLARDTQIKVAGETGEVAQNLQGSVAPRLQMKCHGPQMTIDLSFFTGEQVNQNQIIFGIV